jgi:hypothetical protein
VASASKAGPSSGCSVAIDATLPLARTLNGDRVRALPPHSGPCGLSSHFTPRRFRLLQSSCDCCGGSQHTLDNSSNHSLAISLRIRFTDDTQTLDKCSSWQSKKTATGLRGLRFATRNNLHQAKWRAIERATAHVSWYRRCHGLRNFLERFRQENSVAETDATAGCFGRQLPL